MDERTLMALWDAAIRRALPHIQSGALRPYNSVYEAESDRRRFYPGIVGMQR